MTKPSKKNKNGKRNVSNPYFRDLFNYKAMHQKTADERGVGQTFAYAPTITQAKKILFGVKQKHHRCCISVCCQCKSSK